MTKIGAGDALRLWLYQEKRKKAMKPKKQRPKTEKRKRTERMNKALAAKKREMWDATNYPTCGICGYLIVFWECCEIDHIVPRGMGGSTRDDSGGNLQLTHRGCNREKGSKRTSTEHDT